MNRWGSVDSSASRLRASVTSERGGVAGSGVRRGGVGSHATIAIGVLEIRIEDLLIVRREREGLAFVEGHDQNTRLHGGHRGRHERFGGAFIAGKGISKMFPEGRIVSQRGIHG